MRVWKRLRAGATARRSASATVPRVGRLAAAICAAAFLAAGGAASAALVAGAGLAVTTGATATTAATATTPVTTLAAPSVVAFTGHGWGHGLGLGQWGANGYALHGWTHDRILAHYYPGTTPGTAAVTTLRVLVASKPRVTLGASAPWTVVDATGATTTLQAASVTLGRELLVQGASLVGPLTFRSAQPLTVDGRAYRGALVVDVVGNRVDVVDRVGLEQYLRSVVAAEMPSSWPPEALQAQAVAARSYALANLQKGQPFDLYGDARSQVYGGVAAETAPADAAVAATKGQVLLYAGKVADALFFSTSGGRTASAAESTGVVVPYLVSVDDPYDTLSPYHDWGPVLDDAAQVAETLKLPAPISSLAATVGPSGRVTKVVVTSAGDSQATFTGNQFRTALGLRSTWFTPVFLQLAPAARSITYGGAAGLSGVAVDAGAVTLEARTPGGDWAAAGDVAVGPDGSFATIVKPRVSTWYRLAWGTARVGLAKVIVHARVTATPAPAGVTGVVRPVAPGVQVQLQHRVADGTWSAVSSTVADSASRWSFGGALAAGTYRVRAAPGGGIAAGVSAPFTAP